MFKNLLLAGMLAALARTPITLDKGTRQLSTEELNRIVIGADIQKVVPPELVWLELPERFRADGTYIRFEHRGEDEGTYRIADSALCVRIQREPELCRFIFLDKNGRYWITRDRLRNGIGYTNIEFIKR